jgi:RNA polymerase sigma factor (TIGR02999 family)
MSEVTLILKRAQAGDPTAAEELLPLVYDELRKLATAKMARAAPGQTLQATALVHEAWLRLGGDEQPNWQNRAHFLGAAAEAMRRILLDRLRAKQREKRGGKQERIDLDNVRLATEDPDEAVLAVDEALERFATIDPEKAQVVKLRYFAGLNHDEIAAVLNISEVTVRRYWAAARAWLYAELKQSLGA